MINPKDIKWPEYGCSSHHKPVLKCKACVKAYLCRSVVEDCQSAVQAADIEDGWKYIEEDACKQWALANGYVKIDVEAK